jgi:hypothetical protein
MDPSTGTRPVVSRNGSGVAAQDKTANVTVRFQCDSLPRKRSRAASFMGISTTQARYLERREPKRIGDDRPRYVPTSSLPIGPEVSIPQQDPHQ